MMSSRIKTKKKSLTDTLFETNFQTKVASELWLNIGGRDYRLIGKTIRIGRAVDNDISLDDRSCSRYHAMITITKSAYILEDLKSRNGVKVNKKSVSKAELKDNDQVQIGDLKGVFFLRQKKSKSAGFPIEETGMSEAIHRMRSSNVVLKLKAKWESAEPKQRMMAVGGAALALIFMLMLGMSGGQSSSTLAMNEDPDYLLDPSLIVDQLVSRDDFNECLEYEDLGNFRKAKQCFSSLALNEEVFVALNRVLKRQNELTELRYEEGQTAFKNYYFDMAILKWQEVLLIADDSSELRAKAESGIRDAEQRKLLR